MGTGSGWNMSIWEGKVGIVVMPQSTCTQLNSGFYITWYWRYGEDTSSIPGLGRPPEGEMAMHSSILAWRTPWTEEPGGLQALGLQRANKSPSSQSYGFSSGHVWMWKLDYKEGWVPKNWCCWTVVLRVPWTAWRSNQSILKEIGPESSLEGLMLKLKLQYFGHLMWRTDSLEKTLMLGKIEGRRRRGRQEDVMAGWHHWLSGHKSE